MLLLLKVSAAVVQEDLGIKTNHPLPKLFPEFPLRGSSAFHFFVMDYFHQNLNSHKSYSEIQMLWVGMDEQQRAPFIELSIKDIERFTEEHKIWQECKEARERKAVLL